MHKWMKPWVCQWVPSRFCLPKMGCCYKKPFWSNLLVIVCSLSLQHHDFAPSVFQWEQIFKWCLHCWYSCEPIIMFYDPYIMDHVGHVARARRTDKCRLHSTGTCSELVVNTPRTNPVFSQNNCREASFGAIPSTVVRSCSMSQCIHTLDGETSGHLLVKGTPQTVLFLQTVT